METTQEYKIGCGLELLDDTPKDSVALVILDLPYYGVVDAAWDNEWKSLDDYLDWCKEWFIKSERCLKDNGTLYNFNSQFKVINACDRVIESNTALKFKQFVTIDKGIQSVAGRTSDALRSYPKATEYFIFYTFEDGTGLESIKLDINNFKNLRLYFKEFQDALLPTKKEMMETIGQQVDHCFRWNSTQWDMPTKETYEKLCELPFKNNYATKTYNHVKREYEDLRSEYEDLRYPFNSMSGFTDVWKFNFYKEKRFNHPTQKPFDLIERIVLTSSNEGDMVVDPAMGTGTSYKVCKSHNRNFMGREINQIYEGDIIKRAMPSTRTLNTW